MAIFNEKEPFWEDNHKDFVYAKPSWRKNNGDLCVAWHDEFQEWVYAKITRRFKSSNDVLIQYQRTAMGGYSKPSQQCLDSNDLYCAGRKLGESANTNTEKEKEVKDVNYIGKDYVVVVGQYEASDKYYCFKMDVKLADNFKDTARMLVVVEDSNGYNLFTVHEIITFADTLRDNNCMRDYNKAKAWVVDVVNMKDHLARGAATERRKLIMRKLEEEKAALEEAAIWKALAAASPEAAKLIKELQALNQGIIDIEAG